MTSVYRMNKDRSPEVSGIAMPSATIALYAKNQIVGTAIAKGFSIFSSSLQRAW